MEIIEYLKKQGITHHLIEHKRVFTVEESTAELGHLFPVKNLLLKEEKGDTFVLVVMKGDERLDTKKVALASDSKKLQFAKPDALLDKLGVTPGSVSLFSLISPKADGITLVMDSRIALQKEVGFHPNDNSKTIVLSGRDAVKIGKELASKVLVIDL